MRGYKGMRSDMTCRGMQYEIGKTYHEDNIALCESGFHFCKNLCGVFTYYKWGGATRFFEVEADGDVIVDVNKCVTGTLTIVRELSKIEVNRAYYSDCRSYGHSFCYGDGCDYYGYKSDGNGYGCGYGSGYNYGDNDSGCGDGLNCGYGDGDGHGNGCDCGRSDGDGCGVGLRLQKFVIFKEVL